jgi:transcriptional regulator
MYQPNHFAEDRPQVLHALMRTYPLATLIVNDADGVTADLIPFLLYADGNQAGVLRAHVARANPLWRRLAASPSCLVVFQGPQAYVSPSWYVSKRTTHKVVPTWNYTMVQARGVARIVEDGAWLRRQLDDLTAAQEGAMPSPWQPSDAPADFLAATIKGVVGIEIVVDSLVGKWKVSQNRSSEDRQGVSEGLQAHGQATMAGLVAGLDGKT